MPKDIPLSNYIVIGTTAKEPLLKVMNANK
jgi:hypothetical protein